MLLVGLSVVLLITVGWVYLFMDLFGFGVACSGWISDAIWCTLGFAWLFGFVFRYLSFFVLPVSYRFCCLCWLVFVCCLL